jgi:hypothetical protein
MPNNYQHGDYACITQHDPDSSFNTTYKPLWNRIMDDHPAFDNITYCLICKGRTPFFCSLYLPTALLLTPPISTHTKKPFSSNTLRNAIGALVEALKQKYQGEWEEALFPVEEVSRWKKIVTDGHNRNLMEGEKENDVFKNTFPLPRQHLVRTRLFPLADF